MKKVFTLIAGMLLVSSLASAQKKWTNIVPNGDMETALPAYATSDEMTADAWNAFWVHEFPKNEEGEEQYQGTATIVEDPIIPGNHCARVVARSEAIADSCGNKTEANGGLASWDCQFFIYATEPIPEGKEVKMTLKVRADKAGSFETQAHYEPGNYNHWQMFGNVNVTTEWTTIEVEATVSADQTGNADGKEFQSVAFNLSTNKEGNVFYFDDVKLEIKDPKEINPDDEVKWINFIRKGDLSEDKFGDFTTFTGRMGATSKDEKAQLVTDKDGKPALTVQTVAWNTFEALKDSLGNDSIDDDGNQVFNKYLIVDGDTILSSVDSNKAFQDWQTQFFVTINHKFVANEPFKFKMWARAERVDGQPLEDGISLDTQVHTMPGSYIHWSFVGSIDGINEEWQQFEFGDDEEPKTVPAEGKGGQTVAFNCNKNKDVAVNLYFRFEELDISEAYVLDNERVLASSDATISVGTNQDGMGEGKLDMNEAIKVLEIDNFANYIDNTKMKVQAIDPETDDVKFVDVDLSAGAFINADGFWQDSDANSIIVELDEDNTADGIVAFVTTNNGVTLDAKGIATKFAFEKDGWRYLFNVNIVDPESYERYLGISDMNVAAPKANVIYDLMGRQLTKPGKGLYIMNGKKVMMK